MLAAHCQMAAKALMANKYERTKLKNQHQMLDNGDSPQALHSPLRK
jgi:hypothetical protein